MTPQEIESRYLIPDRALFARLRHLHRLDRYEIEPKGTVRIVDRYVDTPGRALLRQGWACRLRNEDGRWKVTLKGPKAVQGSVITRPEYEISLLEGNIDISRWPPSTLRDRVRELSGGLSLRLLIIVRQTRHQALLKDGPRSVAELSLDAVRTSGNGLRQRSYMLECELLEHGELVDLECIDRLLIGAYGLIPEPRSKLRRALVLIESGESPDEKLMRQVHPVSIETLAQRYGVPSERIRALSDWADRLFVGLRPLHRLGEPSRELLRLAAHVQDLADVGGAPAHLIGRDILLNQPIEGLDEAARRILAATVYLARKRVDPDRVAEVIPVDWAPERRHEALVLCSLMRIARALVGANSELKIDQRTSDECSARIVLAGEKATKYARRADQRSDLWRLAFTSRLEWGTRQQDTADSTVVLETDTKRLGIHPWDTMAVVAAKVLQFHFLRMLENEPRVRAGANPKAVHDMRVATRRMRAAIRLFGPFIASSLLEQVTDDLRYLGRVLGNVRDLDVALERLDTYGQELVPTAHTGLQPLKAHWQRRREYAHARMLRYLNSSRYQRLLKRMRTLLATLSAEEMPAAGEQSVAQIASPFLYVRWQVVEAYGPVLDRASIHLLHALRIEAKRLRYALEFLSEVLPKDITRVIPDVIAVQDHLGEMHDAVVAADMIGAAMEARKRVDPAIESYRQHCLELAQRYRQTFPVIWERFHRKRHRRALKALKAL